MPRTGAQWLIGRHRCSTLSGERLLKIKFRPVFGPPVRCQYYLPCARVVDHDLGPTLLSSTLTGSARPHRLPSIIVGSFSCFAPLTFQTPPPS